MTNAPETRNTHVVRLVGTNANGDVLQDIWVDVERIDQMAITTQTSLPSSFTNNQWQEVFIRLIWRDDPTDKDLYIPEDKLDADQDQNTGRVHEIVKVCSPDEDDLAKPSEWVAIKTITHIDMRYSDLDAQKRFLEVAKIVDAKGRKVDPRRIYHYDTNMDDKAQAAFDADATLKAYVTVGHDITGENEGYKRDDSTKDEDDYVEHEIIESLGRIDSDNFYSTGGQFQEVQFNLFNQYLIDESDPAKLDKNGPNDVNPPYRLDPFQNIINVNWGGLAVEFGDKDEAPPDPPLLALPMAAA